MAKNNDVAQLVAVGLIMGIGYAAYTGKLGSLNLGGFKLPTPSSLGGAIASPTSSSGLITAPGASATNARPAADGPTGSGALQGSPGAGGWTFSKLFNGNVQSPLPYQVGNSQIGFQGPNGVSYSATLAAIDGDNSGAKWTVAPLAWDPTYAGGFGAWNPDASKAFGVTIPWDTSPDTPIQGLPAVLFWNNTLGARR